MKRVFSIMALTALAAFTANAQNGTLDPANPPEPQLKYRLTVTAQPAEAAALSGGGEYAEGTQVTLQARPAANYELRYWLCNGEQLEQTSTSFRVVMPASDVAYIAVLEYVEPVKPPFDPSNPAEPQVIAPEYPLYLMAEPAGAGTFNRNSGAKAKEGTSLNLRATPVTGYQFVGWYDADGSALSTTAQFSYTMPDKAATLTARFVYSPGNPTEPTGNQDDVDITPETANIDFADEEVKRVCVENWDTNGDGELSVEEAEAVTTLNNAFKNNNKIVSFDELKFFTGITRLEMDDFSYCSNLTTISLPNSLTSTDQNVFVWCTSLSQIEWPDNDGFTLGLGLFQFCTFRTITLPANLTYFTGTIFSRCENLAEILVDEANPYYQSIDGVVYSKDRKTIVAYPGGKETTEYTILDEVEEVGYGAFSGCSKLLQLNIPPTVSKLNRSCFNDMPALQSLTIPENVTEIPPYCCAWDFALEEVNIPCHTTTIGRNAYAGIKFGGIVLPSTLQYIDFHAFYDADEQILKEVISEITEPSAISHMAFYDNTTKSFTSATLYVPKGTKEKYEALEGWKNFQAIIEIEERIKGDVNCDGGVDVADIAAVIDMMAKGDNDAVADVNGDGTVDVADIATIISEMAARVR